MKKRRLMKTIVLAAGMVLVSSLYGCGGGSEEAPEEARVSDTGKVLNIHTSGNELKERIVELYPKYEDIDSGTGMIGDVKVNWIITPNDDNAYQIKMDEYLKNLETDDADKKIDLFTVEADYAKKYVRSGALVPMSEIGLSEKDMGDQYAYTKEMVTGEDGQIYGSSWQATPGFFIYRRSIATEVFGTDDPVEIQKHLSTWDKMDEAAALLKEKGYPMFAAYNDTFYPFNANKKTPWVNDDLQIQIDDVMYDWVEQTKNYTDNGYNDKKSEMSDIVMDICKEGKVFGAFAAPWYMSYIQVSCLDNPEAAWELGNGSYADWAVCNGPESFYWGGTWLCVPEGCDNVSTVKDIIYALTCDDETMKQLVNDNGEFVNNSKVMSEIADSDYQCDFLGGQNHIGLLIDSVENIDMSNVTVYDQGVGDAFKNAMMGYFEGNKNTIEDAVQVFYEDAIVKYPELTKPE